MPLQDDQLTQMFIFLDEKVTPIRGYWTSTS